MLQLFVNPLYRELFDGGFFIFVIFSQRFAILKKCFLVAKLGVKRLNDPHTEGLYIRHSSAEILTIKLFYLRCYSNLAQRIYRTLPLPAENTKCKWKQEINIHEICKIVLRSNLVNFFELKS